MNQKIIKPGVVRRIAEKIADEGINIPKETVDICLTAFLDTVADILQSPFLKNDIPYNLASYFHPCPDQFLPVQKFCRLYKPFSLLPPVKCPGLYFMIFKSTNFRYFQYFSTFVPHTPKMDQDIHT